MFKTLTLYRFDASSNLAIEEERLKANEFAACGTTQAESHGWVPPRGIAHGPLLENVGGEYLLRLRSERRNVPGDAIKHELDKLADKIEGETGRRPKGKHLKELKEQVTHELMPRAFSKFSETVIWISPEHRFVVVGTTGAAADRIVTAVSEALSLRLDMVQTQSSAATMMAHWLQDVPPTKFTVDRECKLAQPDSEKSKVAYSRHNLDRAEIGEHLREGKQVESLALTWDSRVSFVLTERLQIRSMKLLDVVLEGKEKSGKADNGFDADVAITTGELAKMLPDLIEAMGGFLVLKQPALELEPVA